MAIIDGKYYSDGSAQEMADLRADAERYRWLRANHEKYDFDENLGQLSLWEHKKGIDYGMKSYAKLDAAIDSAMKPVTSPILAARK